MAKAILDIPETDVRKVIDIIRAGCDYFDGFHDFTRIVVVLRQWCEHEEEYFESLPKLE
jgi:hypothetical protein